MGDAIRFVLGNFTLTFLLIGLIASLVSLLRTPKPLTLPIVIEALFFYFLMFSIGFGFLYNFVLHTFFGEMAARFIGWSDSPFQAEVGSRASVFRPSGFWPVGAVSTFGSRPWLARHCFCSALPRDTFIRSRRQAILRLAMPA